MSNQLRCPDNKSKLLAILRDDSGQLLCEVSCQNCRKAMVRAGDPSVGRVLHRFNSAGLLVETEIVRALS